MIKKLLSNAMLSIVMDKQAKEKFHALRQVRKYARGANSGDTPAEPDRNAAVGQAGQSRQELIAEAMAIHRSQSKILDNLTLNEKRQLQDLAARALLGSEPGDGGK